MSGRRMRGRSSSRLRARRPRSGEEGSVDHQGPGSEWKDEGKEPGVSEDVQVEEDDKYGCKNRLDEEDKGHIRERFANEESRGGRRRHALGFEHLVALFAGP